MLPADGAYLIRDSLAGFLLPGDADLLSQALFFETTQNLPGDMLVKVDRMSMANSLRSALSVCSIMSLENWRRRFRTTGRSGMARGKYILLRALQDDRCRLRC
jgi:hypothetical protein